MKKKSISQNYLYNVVYQLLVILLPLITTPYISRVLGAEGVGKYSYAYSLVTYFTLLAVLGTSVYGQREIAAKRDNRESISIIFFEILLFRGISTSVVLISYMIFIFYVRENNAIMIVQSLYIIAVFFDISWFFQGLEEFKTIIIRNLIIKGLNLIFIFIFIKDCDDLVLYIVGLACFTVIGNFTIWFYLPKYVKKIPWKQLRPFRNIRQMIEMFIPTIAMQIYLVLDKTMIGAFAESSLENGYYEQAEKIVKVSLTIVTAMGTVMIPRISYVFAKESIDKVKEHIYRSYRFVWFLGWPIFFGLIAMSNIIVPWFLGNGFEKCTTLICILSFLVIVIGISNVTGTQYLIPVRKQRIYTITLTIGAIINLALNFILIPRYFSIGAAVASIIAEIVITIGQLIYVIYGEEKFDLKKIINPMYKYLTVSVGMFILLTILKKFFEARILDTFFLILIGGAFYLLMMAVLKDEFVIKIYNILKSKFNKPYS